MSSPDIAWIRPPEPIRGLDHLGAQAPCTSLYTQLLPGITNVTHRARYYTFEPWLLWSFEQRYQDHSLDSFRRVLRRAECLFALIAIRHARVLDDGDDGKHGGGAVGVRQLLRIPASDEPIVLDAYATPKAPHQYFKNALGGLGQYYFGPLRDLCILDHSHRGPAYPPGYDRERGPLLAQAFAAGVPEDAFFKTLEAPAFYWTDLDALAAFCPCNIATNATEHELLLDLFLARKPLFQTDGASARRASLAVMLDLATRCASYPADGFERILRGASYTGAFPDGAAWEVDRPLQQAKQGWGTYQRNELLSVAVQGLFAAILCATNRDRRGSLRQTGDAADVAISLLSSLATPLSRPLNEVVADLRTTLPILTNWQHEEHELKRGWKLVELGLANEHLEELAEQSIGILLALLARGIDDNPYADFELDPDQFDPQEIHLLSFRRLFQTTWSTLTLGEWIRWLALHWCIGQHLRVALRKLRGEQRDTFRIRPLESEFRVVEAPQPTFTFPRVGNTVQILRDLGLIDYNAESAVILTALGSRELEACRGT